MEREEEQIDTTNLYFGGCPYCGKSDGFFNVNRAHYFKCDEHRVKWFIGTNQFRCWRFEGPEDWKRNWEMYGDYEDVKPVDEAVAIQIQLAQQERKRGGIWTK